MNGGLSIEYWVTKKMNAVGMMMFTWIWSGANRVVFEGIEPKWLARVDSMFWIEKGGESDFSKIAPSCERLEADPCRQEPSPAGTGRGWHVVLSNPLLLRLPLIVHMILRNRLMHRSQMLFKNGTRCTHLVSYQILAQNTCMASQSYQMNSSKDCW